MHERLFSRVIGGAMIRACKILLLSMLMTMHLQAQDSLKDKVDLAMSLADGLILQKEFDEALNYLAYAYKYAPEVYGEVSKEVADVQLKMGKFLRETAYLRDANIKLDQAFETFKKLYGEDAKELIPLYWIQLRGRYYREQAEYVEPLLSKIKNETEKHYGNPSVELARYYYEIAYQNTEYHYQRSSYRRKSKQARKDAAEAKAIALTIPSMLVEATAWQQLLEYKNLPLQNQRNDGIPILETIEETHKLTPLPDLLMGHVFEELAYQYKLIEWRKQKHYTDKARRMNVPMPIAYATIYRPSKTRAPELPESLSKEDIAGRYIDLKFNISMSGRVNDPIIVDSNASDPIRIAAIEAITKFRYPRRYEYGFNIDVKNMTYRFEYDEEGTLIVDD